jgi:hypothetical protein
MSTAARNGADIAKDGQSHKGREAAAVEAQKP